MTDLEKIEARMASGYSFNESDLFQNCSIFDMKQVENIIWKWRKAGWIDQDVFQPVF